MNKFQIPNPKFQVNSNDQITNPIKKNIIRGFTPETSPLTLILSPLKRGEGRGGGEFYLFLICLYPFESKALELLKFQYFKIFRGIHLALCLWQGDKNPNNKSLKFRQFRYFIFKEVK